MEGDQFPDRCLNWLASREGSEKTVCGRVSCPGGKAETQLTKTSSSRGEMAK